MRPRRCARTLCRMQNLAHMDLPRRGAKAGRPLCPRSTYRTSPSREMCSKRFWPRSTKRKRKRAIRIRWQNRRLLWLPVPPFIRRRQRLRQAFRLWPLLGRLRLRRVLNRAGLFRSRARRRPLFLLRHRLLPSHRGRPRAQSWPRLRRAQPHRVRWLLWLRLRLE